MPENKSRFVLACQQALALAVVATVGVSAAGVVQLEIVAPGHDLSAAGGLGSEGSLVSSAPVKPQVRTIPLGVGTTAGHDRVGPQSATAHPGAQQIRVLSAPETATGYATVGVTWTAGQHIGERGITLSVRTKKDGTWSGWQPMHYDPEHEPDPGEEGSRSRPLRDGTDAVVVGKVDKVQVRVVTRHATPQGLDLAIIDPGANVAPTKQAPAIDTGTLTSATTTASTTGSTQEAATLAGAKLHAAKPKIFSRAQWGADESMRDPSSLHYGKITAGFVHHTVNANDYSRAEVPAIIRGIYAYHTQSRGWSDIGYNFLVDRFGQIWEGRYGGVDRPVVGAHTLGYNESSFAMSAIGNYDITEPSKAMIKAYAALFAWKLAISGVRADATHQWVVSRYLPAINGHRDVEATACPGKYLYARIPDIRRMAAALQHTGTDPTPTPTPSTPTDLDADLSGGSWPDLAVRDRSTGHLMIVRTAGQLGYLKGRTAAHGWGGDDLLAAPGDLTGDKVPDLLARDASTGSTALYPGRADGNVGPAARTYRRFSALDQVTGVGDFNGDGTNDVVGRRTSDKALLLYPGTGDGGFRHPRVLARSWNYGLTTGVGDLDSDGHPDLLARKGSTLVLFRGTGSGVRAPVTLSGSWGGYDVITGRGDATGDGVPDVLARDEATRRTYVFPGDGTGHLEPAIAGQSRFRDLDSLTMTGSLSGGGEPEVAGISPGTGRLRVFAANGRRNLGRVLDSGTDVNGADLVLNVGDWNRDGRGDVMTRDASTGTMQLRLGRKGGHFAAPVVAGSGWSRFHDIAPVGDVTGDGFPDLLVRTHKGFYRVFPGDGKHGFERSVFAHKRVPAVAQVGMGMWDGDTTPDSAVLRPDGSLWLYPGDGGARRQLASGLTGYDWVRGLGDVNGDGRPDVVAREKATGYLWLLPGRKDGLGSRRLIGTGFDAYDLG